MVMHLFCESMFLTQCFDSLTYCALLCLSMFLFLPLSHFFSPYTYPHCSAPVALPGAGDADPSQLSMSSCYPTLSHIVIIGSGIIIIIVIIGSGMTTRRDEHAAHHVLARLKDWFGGC